MACLYVGNLPAAVTDMELRALIENTVGPVLAIRLMSGKTFCFVELANQEDLDVALARRMPSLRGRRLAFGPGRKRCAGLACDGR